MRRGRGFPTALVTFAVLGALLAAGMFGGTSAGSIGGGNVAPSTVTEAGISSPASGAVMSLASPPEGAGTIVLFQLTVSPVDCGAPVDNLSVSYLTFAMGDGFRFLEPLPPETSCSHAPWIGSVSFGYAYATPGTYRVNASATYVDGVVVDSNNVTVHVTNAPTSVLVQYENETLGIGIATLVILGSLLVLRWRLPPSPPLPLSRV